MTEQLQIHCKALVIKWKEHKDIKERDELFFCLLPYLIKWIRSIVIRWGIVIDDHEVLSLAWQCFMHGLNKYQKIDVPLPYHFHRYSMYCLYIEFIAKKKLNEVSEVEQVSYPDENSIEYLARKLPCRVRNVLQDVITQQKDSCKTAGYYEMKKMLKNVIKEMVG